MTTMDWSEVLDPEAEPREVLLERVPELHRSRLEQYRGFVETPLIFSILFADVDQRFTARFDADDARVVEGDMIDFPQATLRTTIPKWRRGVALMNRLAKPADEQIDRAEGAVVVTDEIKYGYEQFDGVFEVAVVDLPDGGGRFEFDIVLNDYTDPPGAPRSQLEVRWPDLVDLANGAAGPVDVARRVSVRGAMGLAFDVGGYFTTELDL